MLDTDIRAYGDSFSHHFMGALGSLETCHQSKCSAEPIDINKGYFATPFINTQCKKSVDRPTATDGSFDRLNGVEFDLDPVASNVEVSSYNPCNQISRRLSMFSSDIQSSTQVDKLKSMSSTNCASQNVYGKRTRQNTTEPSFDYDKDCCASPAKRLKKPSCVVKSKEMQAFFRLLEDPVVNEFLLTDSCRKISDKYLIAMVFAYFKRASFTIREYTRTNFFVALYLANDMEEDEEDYKYEIFPWALGKNWRKKYPSFLLKRDNLWKRIKYRAVVSRKSCEEVMAIEPNHYIWTRERPEHHAGALRNYMRDPDDDGYPRGPDLTPRHCDMCTKDTEYDSASPDSASWYLSSCSDSSPDLKTGKTVQVVSNASTSSRFDMEGPGSTEYHIQLPTAYSHMDANSILSLVAMCNSAATSFQVGCQQFLCVDWTQMPQTIIVSTAQA